jgi:hypothetical protein
MDTISAIPDNWRKVCFYQDVNTVPEFIPDIENLPSNDLLNTFKVSFLIDRFREDTKFFKIMSRY